MTDAMLHFPVSDDIAAAIDEVRGDETRADWILGAIGLRLSPLPEEIAAVVDPDMVPPGLTVIGECPGCDAGYGEAHAAPVSDGG